MDEIAEIPDGDVRAMLERARRECDRLRAYILDIDAHATPYGDLPDEPGYVGTYLVTAGALHRALGTIGHTAPSCTAEARVAALEAEVAALRAVRDEWAAMSPNQRTQAHLIDGGLTAALDALKSADEPDPAGEARRVRDLHRQGIRPDGAWGCLGCDWEQDAPHRDHVADMVAAAQRPLAAVDDAD